MKECVDLFRLYLDMLSNHQNHPEHIKDAYEKYQVERSKLNANIIKKCNNDYKHTIDIHDDRRLWSMIDWSGKMSKAAPKNHPSIGEMTDFFSTLYEPIEKESECGPT